MARRFEPELEKPSPAGVHPAVLCVMDDRGGQHLLSTRDSMAQIPELGVVSIENLRANLGRRVSIGARSVVAIPASSRDRMEGLKRRAQTVGPKDAASLIFNAGIEPDALVVEAGTGSGWLTVALAIAVGPRGRVVTYEGREDFASFARANLSRAGMEARVEIRHGDIRDGIAEVDVDAVVLDIPEPWSVLEVAWKALRIGGSVCAFSPNTEQVRTTVESLRKLPFIGVRTAEIIERDIVVHDGGTRPSFAPIGHTGYLTFARKVLDTF
jgi:tRNA (adenine57-N1/adenine58-N1)-methyltransferase catalytic subunit